MYGWRTSEVPSNQRPTILAAMNSAFTYAGSSAK
jgi:hypothetical protein